MKNKIFKTFHYIIILNFLIQIAYCVIMIFFIFKNPGDSAGPLFEKAISLDHEFFVKRRLYAIEFWIATGGCAIYLALTEFRHLFTGGKNLNQS